MSRRIGAGLHRVLGFGRGSGFRRGALALLFLVLTAGLFASVSLPSTVDLHAGEVAPVTITAPRDFVDQAATSAARAHAEAQVGNVYTINQTKIQQALSTFNTGVETIKQANATLSEDLTRAASGSSAAGGTSSSAASAAASSASAAASAAASSGQAASSAAVVNAIARLRSALGLPGVTDGDYSAVLINPASSLDSVSSQAGQDLQATLTAGLLDDQAKVQDAQQQLVSEIDGLAYPSGIDHVYASLAAASLVPDKLLDPQATTAAKQQAGDKVKPVTIARGQAIVRAHELVTAAQIEQLTEAGLMRPGGTAGVVAGAALVAVLLFGLCWAFLAQFHRRAVTQGLHLLLFATLVVGALAVVRAALPLSAYLAPVVWSAMLATVAFDPGVALFVAGITALASGLLAHDLTVAVVALTGAWTAVFTLRHVQQRSDLLRAGFYAGLVEGGTALLVLGLFLKQQGPGAGFSLAAVLSGANPLPVAVLASTFVGMFSGMLAVGTLPLAEALGVLTPFRLLELANPDRPLLRRLLTEAPGTYHHSLMVANIAEAASQAVGADALLVRAGAYYHDIGKLNRPAYFIENQMGGENPHDKLSPQLSALVITSHVRDGVDMAHAARLPEEIVNFIRTHHGTTLVQYFYRVATRGSGALAAGEGPAVPVSEDDFRYDGPVPWTRETAIVMLADGVEAAVRARAHPTIEDIEGVIARLIADRLDDGQLEAAALTLKDLHTISVTFRRILVGAYHARIEYPQALADQIRPELRPGGPSLGPPSLPPGTGA